MYNWNKQDKNRAQYHQANSFKRWVNRAKEFNQTSYGNRNKFIWNGSLGFELRRIKFTYPELFPVSHATNMKIPVSASRNSIQIQEKLTDVFDSQYSLDSLICSRLLSCSLSLHILSILLKDYQRLYILNNALTFFTHLHYRPMGSFHFCLSCTPIILECSWLSLPHAPPCTVLHKLCMSFGLDPSVHIIEFWYT